MIFPLSDLVPNICYPLSARDIRAIACVSRDVHRMIAPFMTVKTDDFVEHLQLCMVKHYRTVWPRLRCTIKHDVGMNIILFHIKPSRLSINHTGVITICSDTLAYGRETRSYVNVRDGLAQYGVRYFERWDHSYTNRGVYVYATPVPIPFVNFIDKFITYVLYQRLDSGYIDYDRGCEIVAGMTAHGYKNLYRFVNSAEFIAIISKW